MDAKRSDVSEKYFSLGQSIAWLYGVAVGPFIVSSWLGFGPFCRPQTLHEFGDFLAGVFSPLAFLFFVISVLIQREEFQLTREEMSSSRSELSKQVAQLRLSAMSPVLMNSIEKSFNYLEIDVPSISKKLKRCLDVDYRDKFGFDFFKLYASSVSHLDDFSQFEIPVNSSVEHQFWACYQKPHPNIFLREVSDYFGFATVAKIKIKNIDLYYNSVESLKDLYFEAGVLSQEDFSVDMLSVYIEKRCLDMYKQVCFILNNKQNIEELYQFHEYISSKMTEMRGDMRLI